MNSQLINHDVHLGTQVLCKVAMDPKWTKNPVLWIRIRSDPYHLAGFGSTSWHHETDLIFWLKKIMRKVWIFFDRGRIQSREKMLGIVFAKTLINIFLALKHKLEIWILSTPQPLAWSLTCLNAIMQSLHLKGLGLSVEGAPKVALMFTCTRLSSKRR